MCVVNLRAVGKGCLSPVGLLFTVVLFVSVEGLRSGHLPASDPRDEQSPLRRITNACVDWELDGSIDVVVRLDPHASRLADNDDRATVIATCLRMLEYDDQFVAGHVILCHLFHRLDPCLMVSGRNFQVRIPALHIDIEYSTQNRLQKLVSYPDSASQRMTVNRYWELLRNKGEAEFTRYNPSRDLSITFPQQAGVTIEPIRADLVADIERLLLHGPKWTATGLGVPTPLIPTSILKASSAQKAHVAQALLDALIQDVTFTNAHLALSQLFGAAHHIRREYRDNGFDVCVDGLTVRIDVSDKGKAYDVAYPNVASEMHLIRHRWLMRAMQK